MGTLRHVAQLVFMALVALAFFLLAVYVQAPFLAARITTSAGMTLDTWLNAFTQRAAIGIGAAWIASVAWYLVSQARNLSDWTRTSGQIYVWFLLAILPLAVFVLALLTMPPAQEGGALASGFFLLNNVAVYYISTVCFSPPSFKYTPPGAVLIRRW